MLALHTLNNLRWNFKFIVKSGRWNDTNQRFVLQIYSGVFVLVSTIKLAQRHEQVKLKLAIKNEYMWCKYTIWLIFSSKSHPKSQFGTLVSLIRSLLLRPGYMMRTGDGTEMRKSSYSHHYQYHYHYQCHWYHYYHIFLWCIPLMNWPISSSSKV